MCIMKILISNYIDKYFTLIFNNYLKCLRWSPIHRHIVPNFTIKNQINQTVYHIVLSGISFWFFLKCWKNWNTKQEILKPVATKKLDQQETSALLMKLSNLQKNIPAQVSILYFSLANS